MKGQINLEFLVAAFIYLIAIGSLFTVGSEALPDFSKTTGRAALNLEARQITTQMLTTSGRYSMPSGTGSDWEENSNRIVHATDFGLAEESPSGPKFLELDRWKIHSLRTFNPVTGSDEYFNYSQFKNLTGADNQYRFNFVGTPLLETPSHFKRCSSPNFITEPTPCNPDNGFSYYEKSGNTVHYGSEVLNGSTVRFLVTSHDGKYDTLYVSYDWDFSTASYYNQGDTFSLSTDRFTVKDFQNRENERGALVVLEQHWRSFGPRVDADSTVERLERYPMVDGEPMRVEVLVW